MTIHGVPKPKKSVRVRKPLKSRSRLKRLGKRGAAFPKVKDPAFRRWLRMEHDCLLRASRLWKQVSPNDLTWWGGTWTHVCWGAIEPAHVGRTQARGAADVGQCVPLCSAAHDFYDNHRSLWRGVTGMTEAAMESRAKEYGVEYRARVPATQP